MSGQEGSGVGGVSEYTVGSGPQEPTVCLSSTSEVTPIGVVIREAGHPRHRGRLLTSGTGAEGSVYYGPITEPQRGNTGEGGHPPAHETGSPRPPTCP